MKLYLNSGYSIEGIYGVEGSPTCAAIKTHITKNGKTVKIRGCGVFIEELKKELFRQKLKIKLFDWDIQRKKILK